MNSIFIEILPSSDSSVATGGVGSNGGVHLWLQIFGAKQRTGSKLKSYFEQKFRPKYAK